MGQQLYAMWDALMDTDPARYDDTGAADRLKRFPPMPTGDIAGTDELQNFLDSRYSSVIRAPPFRLECKGASPR
jgi:hypothetical protein